MATSKIELKAHVVQNKTGSVTAQSKTITALDTLNLSDSNAYYLIVAQVTPTYTESGKFVQIRMTGTNIRGELRNSIAIIATKVVKGNGSTLTVSTYQDSDTAQDIVYNISAIKLL